MFGRQLTMKLKIDSLTELTRIHDDQILPILRQQKGFLAATIFVSTDRSEAIAHSMWDTKETADGYATAGYPLVLTALASVIDGTPSVADFDFVRSTLLRVNAIGIS